MHAARARARPGHASQPLPHRQRAREGGRGRAPHRRVPARDADPRHVAALRRRHGLPRRAPRRCSTPTASSATCARRCRSGWPARPTPAPTRRSRPRSSTAAPRPTSSPTGRARDRHPHAARARPGADVRAMLDEILGDLAGRGRGRRPPTTTRPPRRRSTRRCGTPSSARDAGLYPGARLVPFLTVGATDARFFRRAGRRPPTASGSSAER